MHIAEAEASVPVVGFGSTSEQDPSQDPLYEFLRVSYVVVDWEPNPQQTRLRFYFIDHLATGVFEPPEVNHHTPVTER